jgi:lipopolysaccharide exporter
VSQARGATGPRYLTGVTLRGARWTYLSLAVSAAVQLVFTATVSRLLAPAEFGVFAAAMIVVNLGRHLGQLGLGPAIVQRADLTRDEVRTAQTLGLLLAGVSAAALLVLARPVASLMRTPEASTVLLVLSVDLALTALAITPLSLMRREMRFGRLSGIEISASVTGYLIVGVLAASSGLGIWSLVLAVLVYDVMTLSLSYASVRPPLRPRLRKREAGPLLRYGGTLSIVGLLEYLHASIDTLSLARFSGAAALGQYNRAMALVSVPFNRLAFGISRVLFPAFSSVQTERERIARGYRLAFLAVGGLVGPLAGGLAAASEDVVLLVLGDQWGFAAALLPLVLIIVAASTLTQFGGIVADAVGALRLKLVIQGLALAVLLPGVLIAADQGAAAIVGTVAAVAALRLIANLLMAAHLLEMGPMRQLLDLGRVLLGGATTYVAVWLLGTHGPHGSSLVAVLVATTTGLAILVVLWSVGPFASTRRELASRIAGTTKGVRPRRLLAALGAGAELDRGRNHDEPV